MPQIKGGVNPLIINFSRHLGEPCGSEKQNEKHARDVLHQTVLLSTKNFPSFAKQKNIAVTQFLILQMYNKNELV
jgi:hypothetical protein